LLGRFTDQDELIRALEGYRRSNGGSPPRKRVRSRIRDRLHQQAASQHPARRSYRSRSSCRSWSRGTAEDIFRFIGNGRE
jgi:hypothetical protein